MAALRFGGLRLRRDHRRHEPVIRLDAGRRRFDDPRPGGRVERARWYRECGALGTDGRRAASAGATATATDGAGGVPVAFRPNAVADDRVRRGGGTTVLPESVVGTVRERRRGRSIIGVSARDRSPQRAKPGTQTVTVTVATSSFTVPAGHSATLRMTLNAAGKRLLTRFATLPVQLSLTGSVTTTRSVAFSLPRVRVGTPKDHWFHINAPCGDCYTMPVAVPITAVPRGARVSVSCHGSGCPFGRRSFAPHKRAFDLAVVLRTSHLEPGTVVEVAITDRGRIGELLRYAIRRGRVPSRSVLCLAPGTSSPRRCS